MSSDDARILYATYAAADRVESATNAMCIADAIHIALAEVYNRRPNTATALAYCDAVYASCTAHDALDNAIAAHASYIAHAAKLENKSVET